MSEAWKTWEGQAVDGFPLQQYLGGSDHSAVYLTQLNNSDDQKAAIKFVPADAAADAQMASWRVAGELTHPASAATGARGPLPDGQHRVFFTW